MTTSMANQAYQDLRDRLILLDIPPGAAIRESQLAEELRVGRTPTREALKRLEGDHLVVSYPRRGTFATQVDITDLAHISELRQILEPAAAAAAARRASPDRRRQLGVKADQIQQSDLDNDDRRALMQYDLSVHRLIYQAAGNPHMEETLVRLDNLATRIWCVVLDDLPAVAQHIREHVSLLRAIVDGEADRAASLATDHVTHFAASIRKVL